MYTAAKLEEEEVCYSSKFELKVLVTILSFCFHVALIVFMACGIRHGLLHTCDSPCES
jgi:hypothetical protein